MSLSEIDILQLTELCNALVDGTLDEARQAQLSQRLAESEEARQFYVRYVGLSASLYEYASETPAEFAELTVSSLTTLTPKPSRARRLWWALGTLTTAAAIVLAVWLQGLPQWENVLNNSEVLAEEFAAQVTGVKNCRWASESASIEPGYHLASGQRLELTEGVAEITFDCGAKVTLEGPTIFQLDSSWTATLQQGRLKAEVPPEAIGFRILSSTVDVVDLGTEFGMVADADGSTDVCVLKGSVEAKPREIAGHEQPSLVMQQRHARRFNRKGNEEIENTASLVDQFTKPVKFERSTKPVNFVHWSFDETEGYVAHSETAGLASEKSDMVLESANDAALAGAHIEGRWKEALRFDGQLRGQAGVPELAAHAPHTVAFWVRIPSDAPPADSAAMVAWQISATNSTAFQPVRIRWNTNPEQGPLGALWAEAGRIDTVGTTNLRDGQWHHVAVVLVPRKRWNIKLYVDGRLEQSSVKVAKKRRAESLTEPAENVAWIGGESGNTAAASERFRGDMDELFIADQALTPQQIGQLFKRNRLPAPVTDEL